MVATKNDSAISALLSLSARIGRDPLLAQASSGNTSVKLNGVLWIKASGKWLAHATREESLVPVDLAEVRGCVRQNVEFEGTYKSLLGTPLRASIETAMHAVLPHRVVIHVHSVNTIAWAVRQDGFDRLTERLAGLRWQWIPYVASGLPLARAVEKALALCSGTNVFVLGNHGLILCGPDCDTVESLLTEVEARVAIPARQGPGCDSGLPADIAGIPQWRLPETAEPHALATDAISRRILSGGILYPCQAVFLGATPFPVAMESCNGPFCIFEGRGVVVSQRMTRAQRAILNGLVQVVQRIEESAPIRYITQAELISLLNADAYRYRQSVENEVVCSHGE